MKLFPFLVGALLAESHCGSEDAVITVTCEPDFTVKLDSKYKLNRYGLYDGHIKTGY